MTAATDEQYEDCAKEFVSYRKFLSAVLGMILTILSITVAATISFTEVKERSLANKERISSMEEKLDKKLDKIIEVLGK
jgi:hypothetical protein